MKNADIAHALHRRLAYLEVRLERDMSEAKAEWCELEADALRHVLERLGLLDGARLERMKTIVRERVFPAIEARRGNVIPLRGAAP